MRKPVHYKASAVEAAAVLYSLLLLRDIRPGAPVCQVVPLYTPIITVCADVHERCPAVYIGSNLRCKSTGVNVQQSSDRRLDRRYHLLVMLPFLATASVMHRNSSSTGSMRSF
jgi:hypothetical protein